MGKPHDRAYLLEASFDNMGQCVLSDKKGLGSCVGHSGYFLALLVLFDYITGLLLGKFVICVNLI